MGRGGSGGTSIFCKKHNPNTNQLIFLCCNMSQTSSSLPGINLEEFTDFGKVRDVFRGCVNDKNALIEFMDNVVMSTNPERAGGGVGTMLSDLSDIYVLVAHHDFPFDALTSSNEISIDLSAAEKNYVLGYVWLCPLVVHVEGNVPCHWISFIDSRISKLNIAEHMIQRYEECISESEESEVYLLPYEVVWSARNYWKKYFMKVYGIEKQHDLSHMITEFGFQPRDIRWDDLISAFEM